MYLVPVACYQLPHTYNINISTVYDRAANISAYVIACANKIIHAELTYLHCTYRNLLTSPVRETHRMQLLC